jgi:SsrA-binding protein
MSHKPQQNISIKNRKASFNYELIERFVAGLKLVGTEIKSIRNGKVNLTDAYCTLIRGEMYVIYTLPNTNWGPLIIILPNVTGNYC